MSRSAILQARVRPEIKFASEQVLKGIGLTMTEAMELFLRRVIVDQKLPFDVVALDEQQLSTIVAAWESRSGIAKSIELGASRFKKSRKREKRE
jgi:addiction module RelB/DinJ family antitoxin